MGIYQPWVHAFRACAFTLIPARMMWDWPDNLCTCNMSARRVVMAEALRNRVDGTGWDIGLQMTQGSSSVNATLAVAAMHEIVFSNESRKSSLSGKNICL